MKLSLIILVLIYFITLPVSVSAEVCITDEDATDLITLLDASERDMVAQSKCESLVKDLYKEVQERGKQVEDLTDQLVSAKQEIIDYRNANQTWRQIAIVTGSTSVILLVIQLAPLL